MKHNKRRFLLTLILMSFSIASRMAFAQSSIAITSPSNGQIVYQGQTLTIAVSADPSVSNLSVQCGFTGCWASQQSAPGTFSITIPAGTSIGDYQLYAVGTVNGVQVSSIPIDIVVDTPLKISSIRVDPPSLFFDQIGDALPLGIFGTLSDGSIADLSHSPQISLSSSNQNVVSILPESMVKATGSGSASIIISGAIGGSTTISAVVARTAVSAPVLTPPAGIFTGPQQITISDSVAGAKLYYTTDGSLPTPKSTPYTGPFTISSTATINALAMVAGSQPLVAWGTYTISTPVAAIPTFSPAAGTFTAPQTVTISDATAGATIYYTTDGTTPTTSSTLYSGPITVSSTETIQAIATASGYSNSSVASATYTINIPVTAIPTFTPAAGTFTAPQTVTISDATSGAAVYYTTDGTTPTASSTLYSSPITVSSTETIQAIATASGYSNSAVASATYTINLPQDFTLGLSASSLSISAPGQSGSVTASIGPVNGFSQPVSFACSGLPSGAACSFSPATVKPNGTASATTTVTISTSATASLLAGNHPYELAGLAGGLIALLFARRRFRKLGGIGVILLSMIAVGSVVSCGGSSTKNKPTTSTVSIKATSGSLAHTASLSLTVQ